MSILNKRLARVLVKERGKRITKEALEMLEGKAICLVKRAIENSNGQKTVNGQDVGILKVINEL